MRILIFLTAYNEAKTVGDVLNRIDGVREDLDCESDVLVVDDGSDDATAGIAADRGAIVVEHPRNLGPGAATQTGYKYAVRQGYDVTVRIDADGQHRPEDIPKLLEPVFAGEADIAVGSRYKAETDYETTAVRNVGIRFFSWLISLITGNRVFDITSGFRAVRIEMGADHADNLPRGIIAIERGLREGLSDHRIVEVPVTMEQREYGTSYLSFGRLVKYPLYAAYSFVISLIRVSRQ